MENIAIIIINCWLSSRTGGAGALTPDHFRRYFNQHDHLLIIVIICWSSSWSSWSSWWSADQPGDARVLVREREDETRRLPSSWSPPIEYFISWSSWLWLIMTMILMNISYNDHHDRRWSPPIEYFLFPIHRHYRCLRRQHHHRWRHKHYLWHHKHYRCCFHCQLFQLFE